MRMCEAYEEKMRQNFSKEAENDVYRGNERTAKEIE